VRWTGCPPSSRADNRPDINRSRIPALARTGMTATTTVFRSIGGDAATAARAMICPVVAVAEMTRRAVNERMRLSMIPKPPPFIPPPLAGEGRVGAFSE